ncbi:MAG: acetate kinase [Candidatus Gracilibacteria bacterium]|jgi:acetate kinase
MKTLVINSGSSSLKFSLFESGKTQNLIAKGHIDGIEKKSCLFIFESKKTNFEKKILVTSHNEAIKVALESLIKHSIIKDLKEISCVGHRVVHGGEKYSKPVKITNKVISEIKKLSKLAPLHNPPNLAGIMAIKSILKTTPQVAVFDTSFHQTMEEKAYLYPIPYYLYKKHNIRKYGFHGTSHSFVISQAQKILKKSNSKIISCHIGNGTSITAALNGKSIDTSMGFTPLEGILMGTRSGSIDPAIILHLNKELKMPIEKIFDMLNKESGLLASSKLSADMRDIYHASLKGNASAKFAIEILSYQLAKYIGSYIAALKGIDAIIFTGGMGEKAFYVRKKTLEYLKFLNIDLDDKKNSNNEIIISSKKSKVKVFVIKTDEEQQIAIETTKTLL